MAAELKETNPAVNIEILGVNDPGAGAFNQMIADEERRLPWVQDDPSNSVWNAWKVTYRDVRILDAQNRTVRVFNLSTYDLSVPANRAMLKQHFLDAARFIDTDGDRLLDDWELLYFGNLSATAAGDADGDGQDNYGEFAFGTHPRDANSRSSFVPTVVGAGTTRQFGLTFQRRVGGGINYVVESSADLHQWSPALGTVTVSGPPQNFFDGTGTGSIRCLLATPIALQPGGFLRVTAQPRPGS